MGGSANLGGYEDCKANPQTTYYQSCLIIAKHFDCRIIVAPQ
jgi:hypothetical protein